MHEVNVVATELARKLASKLGPKHVRIALVGLAAVLLLVLLWRMHPYSKRGETACAFRIASESSARPAIQGDAALQLDTCVRLEKAVTNSARVRGLSGRQSMNQDQGMLFDFGVPGTYCIWMKDMNFSLDMLWLNEQEQIVSMREDVSPQTYPKTFCGPEEARYVVEVNAGIVKNADLRVGQHLNL